MTIRISLPQSWRTSLVGLGSLLGAAYQAHHLATLSATLHDPLFWIAVLAGVQGMLSKDSSENAPPAEPAASQK